MSSELGFIVSKAHLRYSGSLRILNHVKPLDSDNDYTRIAQYFVKYANKTEETLGRRIGKRWNSSRNLKEPVIVKQVVNANTFADKKGEAQYASTRKRILHG